LLHFRCAIPNLAFPSINNGQFCIITTPNFGMKAWNLTKKNIFLWLVWKRMLDVSSPGRERGSKESLSRELEYSRCQIFWIQYSVYNTWWQNTYSGTLTTRTLINQIFSYPNAKLTAELEYLSTGVWLTEQSSVYKCMDGYILIIQTPFPPVSLNNGGSTVL